MTPRVVMVSDLDHTMVQNEDPTHKRLLAFNHVWTAHCKKGADLLVFSTGRSPVLFTRLWRSAPLLTPDILICSVGTELFYNQASPVAKLLGQGPKDASQGQRSGWALFEPDVKWEQSLSDGWSREAVEELVAARFPKLLKQAASEQRPHKISFVLQPFTAGTPSATDPAYDQSVESPTHLVQRLRHELQAKGIKAKVIFSAGRDVDVLAAGAGKGFALAFLVKQLKAAGWPFDIAVASGDSGNDAELMEVPGVNGCIVSNAHAELKRHADDMAKRNAADHILQAKNPCAAGIIEALLHFGAVPASSPALQHMAHVFSSPITLAAPTNDAATPLQGPSTAQHGPDTTVTPVTAHAAPGGAVVVDGPADDVPESGAAVTAAVLSVVSHYPTGPTPQAVAHTNASPLLRSTSLQGYDIDTARREWVWRLAGVLAGELSTGWLPSEDTAVADDMCLMPHSNLRLFITNDCKFTLTSPPLRPWASCMLDRKLSSLSSVEFADDDLSPEGTKAAGSHDPATLARRTWVDQLQLQVPEPDNKTTENECLHFSAAFKVCLLTQSGLRSPACWEVKVDASMPQTPVPEAFLAHAIAVSPPWEADQTTVQFEN